MNIIRLDHLVLTVKSIEATCGFYSRVLGFKVLSFVPKQSHIPRTALTFGQQKINLHQQGSEFEPKALHPTPGSADLCFVHEGKLDDVITHLKGENVPTVEGPVPRSGAVGTLKSVYVRDPDMNLIEISTYGEQ